MGCCRLWADSAAGVRPEISSPPDGKISASDFYERYPSGEFADFLALFRTKLPGQP